MGGLVTQTHVVEGPSDSVIIDGSAIEDKKIDLWLEAFREAFEIPPIRIESTNNFPVNSGLASSASGFAALTLATAAAFELSLEIAELCHWARRGSASAARSIHGGFVALETAGNRSKAKQVLPENEWDVSVAIAIASSQKKVVGSTAGMKLSEQTSPYYNAWLSATKEAYQRGLQALRTKDFSALGEVAEASCRQMHALMLSSEPALIYWNGTTLACIAAIQGLQREGVPVFYTIDAGPHVKAVCETHALHEVLRGLNSVEGVLDVRASKIGGPARMV